MSYILPLEKQVLAISLLTEGSSIRAVERVSGIHRDTIMRLSVRVGEACRQLMDTTMRNLPCRRLELDEIWGYVTTKQKWVKPEDPAAQIKGDMWTYVAIDPETKAIPAFTVGKRELAVTNEFVSNLASRMRDRIQLSSDGMQHYEVDPKSWTPRIVNPNSGERFPCQRNVVSTVPSSKPKSGLMP